MNAHIRPPAEPQEAFLYVRTPVTPEQAFQAIGRLRKEARDEIDRLIRFLDKTDDYVSRELEDCGDDAPCDDDELEMSFCGVTAEAGKRPTGSGGDDELEGDDVWGGDAEAEPSLGSTTNIGTDGSQTHWASGGARDLEDEHDGSEPSLCGITADDIIGSTGDRDLEEDDADRDDDTIREPSLGWPERVDQTAGVGCWRDKEATSPEAVSL
jgi:hypothetical protein